ncbi:hypothetical protein ACFQ1S_28615 [Kibdelosporangium lantanae]|uniref:Uncharacterized protein n=1 Tax=Kibdelosporangium lantanae TaxID=1497396 RepID=A0ABW3MET5_9PSEU
MPTAQLTVILQLTVEKDHAQTNGDQQPERRNDRNNQPGDMLRKVRTRHR